MRYVAAVVVGRGAVVTRAWFALAAKKWSTK